MSATVWKYPFAISDDVVFQLPRGARLLSIQPQGLTTCLWALVDPEQPDEPRRVRIAGTGHELREAPDTLAHISTFQLYGGELVFHAFEVVT